MAGNTEVRITDEGTGGEKGQKLDRYDLIPIWPLRVLARIFGVGAQKYADRNWEKGYDWSLSYGACQRHLNAFWGGEFFDSETHLPHLAHAAWHCLVMIEFWKDDLGTDDRAEVGKWE